MALPFVRLVLLVGLLVSVAAPGYAQERLVTAQPAEGPSLFSWEQIAALPDTLGVSGACAGISNGALLIAGGTNFPTPLSEGGQKAWHQRVYVLERTADGYAWRDGGRLEPMPSYGASITTERGVLCIGGSDGSRYYDDVFLLQWTGDDVRRRRLPALPKPVAKLSAVLVGATVYVAGGQRAPEAPSAMKNFWALDLSADTLRWQVLEPWPGPARLFPVAAAKNGAFYLFSGAALVPGDSAGVVRRYLTDAYRYTRGEGWGRLAALPLPALGAPPPAVDFGPSHLLILGGDAGSQEQPGFQQGVLAYHTITDTWTTTGTVPFAMVTTPAVRWNGAVIVPGGEVRPGTRSPAIYRGVSVAAEGGLGALAYAENRLGIVGYLVLFLYFLILVGMGFYFSGREHTPDDFFLAGRRIPWWAAGTSIFGTQLSAITFMAIPAKAYATNWVYILGQVAIVLVAPIIVYFYLPVFRRLNVATVYEYLEQRFNVLVRLFSSTAFILLQLGRMGIVIFLPALALSTATGFDPYATVLFMGVLCTFYTTLGGIEADIWSDVLQVIVLLGGALLSLGIIISGVDGGFGGFIARAAAYDKFHTFNWTWDWTTTAVWVVLFGNILANLIPYSADQTVVQRYLTTNDEAQAARSVWTNAALTIPAALIFFGLGTALFVFYAAHPLHLEPTLSTDAIVPLFIVRELPDGLAGLLLAGIFAAAMSSLDSSMNSVSMVVVTDFYRRFVPDTSEAARMRLARRVTVGVGFLATVTGLVMVSYEIQSLFDVFLELIGLFGGSLAGLVALGLFTRRAHGRGALVGAGVSVVVLYLVTTYTAVHFFLYGAIGILTCFGVGYLASMLWPRGHEASSGVTFYDVTREQSTYRPAAEPIVQDVQS